MEIRGLLPEQKRRRTSQNGPPGHGNPSLGPPRLTSAAMRASTARASSAAAETRLASRPSQSMSGFRSRGIDSGGSHAGNARLIRFGTTTAPHQKTTAPSSSSRPVHPASGPVTSARVRSTESRSGVLSQHVTHPRLRNQVARMLSDRRSIFRRTRRTYTRARCRSPAYSGPQTSSTS